jgi:hypothetical protein
MKRMMVAWQFKGCTEEITKNLKIMTVPVEIETEHFLNTCLERYTYSSILGEAFMIFFSLTH